jgi:succinoglycan biosynthesis transport protein ExoP
MINTDQKIDTKPGLRDYWQIFLRRKWLIILPIIIIPFIAIPGSFVMTPVYEATTTLMSQENSRSSFVQSTVNVPPGEQLSTIRYKIQLRSNMMQVADKIGIAQYLKGIGKPAEMEDQVRYLREIVTLKPLSGTILEISVLHPKPDMAKNIADTVALIYVDSTKRWRQNSASDASNFINQELGNYRTKLRDAETALVNAQEKGVLESLNGENNTLVNEVAKLRANQVEVELDLQEAASELQNAKRMSGSGNENILAAIYVMDPEITRLQNDLNNFQLQYAQLSNKYTDDYPPVKKLKDQIAQTRDDLNMAKTKLSVRQQDADTRMKYWTERVRSLELRRTALNDRISAYDRKLQQLPQRQLEIARLQREKAAAENTYYMLLQRLNESDLMSQSESRNMGEVAQVLDYAVEPIKPIKPNKKKIAVLAIAMGLMIGGGATFLLEYFDRSFHSVDEVVNYFAIPVLGTIPKLIDPAKEFNLSSRRPIVIICVSILSLIVLLIIIMYPKNFCYDIQFNYYSY